MPKSPPDTQLLRLKVDALHAVLDEMGAYIFTKDIHGCYTFANRKVLELFGFPLDQVLGKDDSHFFDLSISNELRVNDLRVMQHGEVIEQEETNVIRETGETRTYWSIKKPLRDASGLIIGMCGISSDITERKRLEVQIHEQKHLLDTVMNNVEAHIYMKDSTGTYLYANRKTAEMFSLSPEQIVGKRDIELMPKEDADHLWQLDSQVFETQTKQQGEESFKDASGRMRHYWTVKIPLQSAAHGDSLIGLSTDITELHLLKEELQRQASTDSLTGLYNRRYFYDFARREFSRSKRSKLPLSVIAIDIDHFKMINDQHGHPMGDAVLCAMAKRCLEVIREADVLARTGGEEFSLLLPETSLNTAMEIAERLRCLLQGHDLQVGPAPIDITISLGVASYKKTENSFDKLFSRADHALLQAKQLGRNRVCSTP
jgi:diguanylate cyclase (GGDEF)-like protein/PAS domain S-box-containing protein